MNVIIVGTSDDDSDGIISVWVFGGIDVFEMRECLQDGFPITVVFGLEARPGVKVCVVHGYYLWYTNMHC